ncbi:MAG: hypothetical protein HY774_12060 [Acidobacteria bacterium]|nr:hypothetical protein [Acidobacteriota bacterium]
MRAKYFLNLVLILVVGITAFLSHPWQVLAQSPTGSAMTEVASKPVTAKNNLKVFEVVWSTINKGYYDDKFNGVDWVKSRERFQPRVAAAATEKELYELLREMVAELKDNHVSVKSPEVAQLLKRRAFPNIGAEFRRIDQQVLVTEVKVPSSASEAGIQPGWILTSVNDVPVEKLDGFSGDVGETLRFKFLDQTDSPRDISLNVTYLATTPIQTARLLDKNVLYVRFDRFEENTGKWFQAVLAQHEMASGLILDLRRNLGGLVSTVRQCLEVLSLEDVVVGEFIERSGKEKIFRISGKGKRAWSKPVVVLIDKYSASGSEILAAAVQETGRGKVVGRPSAGAVLASIKKDLPDGGELQYSIRDFLTVRNVRLEGHGVKPDEVIELSVNAVRQNNDQDVARALEILGQ